MIILYIILGVILYVLLGIFVEIARMIAQLEYFPSDEDDGISMYFVIGWPIILCFFILVAIFKAGTYKRN